MSNLFIPPLHPITLTGVLLLSFLSSPSYGHERDRQTAQACATTKGSSAAAAAASGRDSHVSSVGKTRKGANAQTNECDDLPCSPTSSVTSGSGGLASSTRMPDGSTVTVRSQNGVVTSSSSTGSSGSSSSASSASGAGHDNVPEVECDAATSPRERDASPGEENTIRRNK